jgi:hypothetical protein
LAIFVATAALGCGGGAPPVNPADAASGPDLSRLADLSASGGTLCSDPRADAWALPITKSSMNGSFKVSLTSADYSPPIIGINTWQLTVADASDAPVTGAITTIKPWMPDMGHGTSVVPSATAGSATGSYTVKPLYFFMAGFWATTFTLTDGATTDTVVYSVCLAD